MQTRVGRKFGLLTVVSRARDGEYVCRCDCGGSKTARWENLRRGYTKSCGCLRGEIAKSAERAHTRTGVKQHPLYETWRTMLRRCNDPKNARYSDYGARGVRVCAAWELDFWAFADFMGEKPSPAHTLDRVDNSGNYEPGNCRWASPDEQANNKRSTRRLVFRNRVVSVTQALTALGLKKHNGVGDLSPASSVARAYVVRQWWRKQQAGERVDWGRISPTLLGAVARRLGLADLPPEN